jgi:sec-independent protein translocase protein TatC
MDLVPFPGSRGDNHRDHDPEEDAGKTSFLAHLDELRQRLIWSIAAALAGFVVALLFIGRIFGFIMAPLATMLPEGQRMIYTEPAEAFLLQLKVAALAGLVIAAPAILWQVWLFIAPGLYRREKLFAVPFVVSTSLLFLAGAAFNHYVVFPLAFAFFAGFGTDYMAFLPRIQPVFSLYVRMLIAFGVMFQMPVLVFTLAKLGLVTSGFLWRNTKYAVFAIFVVASLITPPDVVSQVLMAVPMTLLYVISIGIAWMFGPRRGRDAA